MCYPTLAEQDLALCCVVLFSSYNPLTPSAQLSQQSSFHCSSVLSWDRFWKQSGEYFRSAVTSLLQWGLWISVADAMFQFHTRFCVQWEFADLSWRGNTSMMMIQPHTLQRFTSFTQINIISFQPSRKWGCRCNLGTSCKDPVKNVTICFLKI